MTPELHVREMCLARVFFFVVANGDSGDSGTPS